MPHFDFTYRWSVGLRQVWGGGCCRLSYR